MNEDLARITAVLEAKWRSRSFCSPANAGRMIIARRFQRREGEYKKGVSPRRGRLNFGGIAGIKSPRIREWLTLTCVANSELPTMLLCHASRPAHSMDSLCVRRRSGGHSFCRFSGKNDLSSAWLTVFFAAMSSTALLQFAMALP